MTDQTTFRRINSALGVMFLTLGAIVTCLVFVDRWTTIKLHFPEFWYRSRSFHVLFAMTLYVLGWWCHRRAGFHPVEEDVLFDSVRVYSKPECELCDRAHEILAEFATVLPAVEEIDISGNSELEQLHGQSIPVVEIDGRVRFRGIVSEELLQRLVDARRRQRDRDLRANVSGEHPS